MGKPEEQNNISKRKADESDGVANKVPKLIAANDGESSQETEEELLQKIAAVRQKRFKVKQINKPLKEDIGRKDEQLVWSEAQNVRKERLLRSQAKKLAGWRARCRCGVFEASPVTAKAQEETLAAALTCTEWEEEVLPYSAPDMDENAADF